MMAEQPIALQLYTVRDETARDFAGTVRAVAEMGYPAVEFAGYGGLSSEQLAALLAETGLRAASTHVGLAALDGDIARELEYCAAIGSRFLVLPWLPPEWQAPDALRRIAPRLNEFGTQCRERGITFAYHNHAWEFAPHEDGYLLDVLVNSTDSALVGLELDVYWAAFAGADPARYLREHAGRVPLLHMKDMAADRDFAEVGDGTLDMRGILAAAQKSGARWYIVENDEPRIASLESARRSLVNLRGLINVE